MGDPFGMYVARGMRGVGGGHPRYLQMRAGRGGIVMCACALTLSSFMFLSYGVLPYLH